MQISGILKALLWVVSGLWVGCFFLIPDEYMSHPAIVLGYVQFIGMPVLAFIAGFFVPLEKWDDYPILTDRYLDVTYILFFIISTYANLNFPHKDCFLTRLFFLN